MCLSGTPLIRLKGQECYTTPAPLHNCSTSYWSEHQLNTHMHTLAKSKHNTLYILQC
jgi:hypothetical protein